ncbi:MAG: Protein translocase subunit SecA [Candidatus Moranbacteria bacterium GW2011_GWC2_37_8]|nr:MAG: Protein translocase subunit SecA [Candidatus Moranbacteria bacterium GW2011_GWC2_37_8]KKQ61873.1 MAG: Protein translocase subunit SecA [Parcubacteria group bacterium GW2011_GWC1_38_22]KKQ81367.1 MAG: Protein translocase subunit SecA [Candidatus Moranbacteria bacterium GW2011_GWD2_38_7]
MALFSKIFGSNEREINKLRPIVEKINSFEAGMTKLTDEALTAKVQEFRERLKKDETLDDIMPEAFAVVRETAKRVIGERHYDVQMLGGIALHKGTITEMKTGEGKTLTSTLPIYLNAIEGKGVHVVTVNDYLAKRDCNWMGSVYQALGLSTACIMHDASYLYESKVIDADEVSVEVENLKEISRREAYAADITYGTNNEFGFDYLRDNMVQSAQQMSQRQLNYAIVDEVDSILIDEARTPLIISAPDTESTKLYQRFAQIVPRLKETDDYEIDEKMKAVTLTESGISKVEAQLGVGNIYELGKINYVHHLEQSLKAETLFKLDRDYVVKDGQVIIVDDFTGRLMEGRRYSDGLHQAIEAKENVEVQKESRTLATITFQNYFRMYNKLAGMTGTASTSAEEFAKVYKLDVLEIPTNKKQIRKDLPDIVYKTEKGKFDAIVQTIKENHENGQPFLVGTVAIEKSEYLSALLEREGIKHEVLNAKHHEKEASIIAGAGQKGAVTIATNMAGRGTDIKLGAGVREVGGLYIIGTERHEARRIDNQLRGRAGRQGDPGVTQFFVSLEDELMRRFGGDRLKNMMDTLGLPEDQPIQNAIISRTIESAQSKIEGYNFDIRKHVLDYDDVMNKQREVVYKKRKEVLAAGDMKNEILHYVEEEIERNVSVHCVGEDYEWDIPAITNELQNIFNFTDSDEKKLEQIRDDKSKNTAEKISLMLEYAMGKAKEAYIQKEQEIGSQQLRQIEKAIVLQTIDTLWMNHLDEIDYLRQGIGLRGYGQRDPLIEYKREAFHLFSHLMENMRSTTVRTIFKISMVSAEPSRQVESQPKNIQYQGAEENQTQFGAVKAEENGQAPAPQKPLVNKDNVGRNDPCPCGSGKKYKQCHGK